jgi:hypothetical protein
MKMSPSGKYPETFAVIWDGIDEELKESLTARELALVVDSKGRSYQQGKADAGAWVDGDLLGVEDKIIPLALVKSITKKQTIEEEYTPVIPHGGGNPLINYANRGALHFYIVKDKTYIELDDRKFFSAIEAGETYLRNNPDGVLYTRQTWYVDEYYIGDQLIYKERI